MSLHHNVNNCQQHCGKLMRSNMREIRKQMIVINKLNSSSTTIDSTTNWDINSFSLVELCNQIYHELTLCNLVNTIYSNHCRFQSLLIIVHLFFHFQLKEVLRECQLLYCFNEFLDISLALLLGVA
jgi:hypothetical protein